MVTRTVKESIASPSIQSEVDFSKWFIWSVVKPIFFKLSRWDNAKCPFFTVECFGLFVCLRVYVFLDNFSLIWKRQHYQWRASNFNLYSELIGIEHGVFFSEPHLLWYGTFVYDRHLWETMTLTPVAERLLMGLSLPFFTTYVCRGRDLNSQPSACEAPSQQ